MNNRVLSWLAAAVLSSGGVLLASAAEPLSDGYDETLTIDPGNLQLLFQGRDPTINGRYDQLPYRLALLKLDRAGP